MTLVVDASAVVEVALNRKSAARIRGLVNDATETLAPDLVIAESVNAIWKEHQFAGLSADICDEALSIAVDLVDTLIPSMELYRAAFSLCRTARRPAYDMFYLALARREDATLVTLDRALKNEAVREGIRVA